MRALPLVFAGKEAAAEHEGNAEDRRRHIYEPEGKGWNKAQEQKIAQCVLLEALAQLAEPGCGLLVQHAAKRVTESGARQCPDLRHQG